MTEKRIIIEHEGQKYHLIKVLAMLRPVNEKLQSIPNSRLKWADVDIDVVLLRAAMKNKKKRRG
jgi:hypothetical protein